MALQRVDDLTLNAINRLIAKVEGIYYAHSYGHFSVRIGEGGQVCLLTNDGRTIVFAPTADWRQGGPLIERNDISVEKIASGWRAHLEHTSVAMGATLLAAAMRTRLKMTYGDEVGIDAL